MSYTKEDGKLVFKSGDLLREILNATNKEFPHVSDDKLKVSYTAYSSDGVLEIFVEPLEDEDLIHGFSLSSPTQVLIEEESLPITVACLASAANTVFPKQSPKVVVYGSMAPNESFLSLEA